MKYKFIYIFLACFLALNPGCVSDNNQYPISQSALVDQNVMYFTANLNSVNNKTMNAMLRYFTENISTQSRLTSSDLRVAKNLFMQNSRTLGIHKDYPIHPNMKEIGYFDMIVENVIKYLETNKVSSYNTIPVFRQYAITLIQRMNDYVYKNP